ncbi:MAG: glycosyltransferase family 4 protein [Bryobacteraceae bacterium]|nr:glycosyltransferase family 4 protein [Bryobacteraceae bacterium]
MPPRIVIDVRYIRDFGIGTYIRNLVQALAAVDRETRFILSTCDEEIPEFANLPSNFEIATHTPPKRELWDHVAYSWFLRGLSPDLVHMPVNVMPLFMPRPYVVTMHDVSTFLFASHSGVGKDLRLFRSRRSLLQARCVIAVSEATRRDVSNLLAVPPDRVRLVYSAPDPRFLEPVPPGEGLGQLLERYQIRQPFILYAGRIRPHKNVPRLIEAFAVVRNDLESHPRYRDLRLIIIGDEISRHPEVRRAVVQTRNQQVVRFLGFVPFETLKMFYSAAELFAFPSLYEGFGLPPLEAMATGTPVVTSSVSSLPEVVGNAAVIVNPENVFDIARGIREVLLDPALRTRLIAAGAEQARRFSWKRTAENVLDVYRTYARRRGAAATPSNHNRE